MAEQHNEEIDFNGRHQTMAVDLGDRDEEQERLEAIKSSAARGDFWKSTTAGKKARDVKRRV